jgi:hypothetical protein
MCQGKGQVAPDSSGLVEPESHPGQVTLQYPKLAA